MMMRRRDVILAACGVAFGVGPAVAQAQKPASGGIRVDLQPALSKGGGEPARQLGRLLDGELRRAFSSAALGANRLLVTVQMVQLNDAGGISSGGHDDGGNSTSDYLETDSVLVDPRGRELGRYHILSPVGSQIGTINSPAILDARLMALAVHNAGWLRRAVAGS